MDQRKRTICWFLVFACLGLLSIAQSDSVEVISEESSSLSESAFSIAIEDRNPCSFRGQFLSHGEAQVLDPCTTCACKNGTTTCNIESCPSETGCLPFEIVIIPVECCPQCPYKMYVEETSILYDEPIDFVIGTTENIKFGLDIVIDRKLTSRTVKGENLWKLGAWLSPNEDGSGPKRSYDKNVFSEKDASKEYSKPDYPPWEWNKIRYTMNFQGESCDDFKYLCVEFGENDNPRPTYNLSFTMRAVNDEHERLVDCKALGNCVGVLFQLLFVLAVGWAYKDVKYHLST